MIAGGGSASCLRMARWSQGAAARSSRPTRVNTTQPWRLDRRIRIEAFYLRRTQDQHPTLEVTCQTIDPGWAATQHAP
jgi:hypothetical protein